MKKLIAIYRERNRQIEKSNNNEASHQEKREISPNSESNENTRENREASFRSCLHQAFQKTGKKAGKFSYFLLLQVYSGDAVPVG